MLVQISPWKQSKTSFQVSKSSSRRRQRDEKETLPIEVSCVTTSSRKGSQKLKHYSTEFEHSMPVLTITSEHRIGTMGLSSESNYEEYSSLQFSSRPGKAGSFFSESKKSGIDLPRIPAILDTKNERVYALQNGNSRLCSWHAFKSTGPDDKSSVKIDLPSPAFSLTLLPMDKGILYGTCHNGDIFVGRVIRDSKNAEYLSVEYVGTKLPEGASHISTFAQLPQGQGKTAGQKRKVSDADSNMLIVFYQTFNNAGSITLVRSEVNFDGKHLVDGSLSQQSATTSLSPGGELANVTALSLTSGTSPRIAIVYSIPDHGENGRGKDGSNIWFGAVMSLSSGNLSRGPIQLPSTTLQCGLVSETVLAVGTHDKVILYDLDTGCTLDACDISDAVDGDSDGYSLFTDTKFGSIGVLFEKEGYLHASFTKVTLEGSDAPLSSEKFNLASKVTSSLVASEFSLSVKTQGEITIVENLLAIGKASNGKRMALQKSVKKALSEIEDAVDKATSTGQGSKQCILLDAFDNAVSSLLDDVKSSQTDSDGNPMSHNPQDALLSKEEDRRNGYKRAKNEQNGRQPHLKSSTQIRQPPSLPQSFIDGALRTIIPLVQSKKLTGVPNTKGVAQAQLDASLILARLLQTGKVSARRHFEGIENIQQSNGEHILTSILRSVKHSHPRELTIYTPLQMIQLILRSCPDVSERQMVVIVNFMLRRALPSDIATTLIQDEHLDGDHPFKKLSTKFLALNDKHSKHKENAEKLERLSRKVILAGTTFLLHQIVQYSECNQAMLRLAFLEELGNQDALILAKLLSELLTFNLNEKGSNIGANRSIIKSISDWVAALCESFQDALFDATMSDGQNYLTFLLHSVSMVAKQSQVIVSLGEDLRHAEQEIGKTGKEISKEPRTLRAAEQIPGYSVDRLVF